MQLMEQKMADDLWSSDEVKAATGGLSGGKWQANGVSIDSRTIQKGDLFIAIKGENFDGHKFVKDAIKKGAGGVIVEEGYPIEDQMVVVENTFKALKSLANYRRNQINGKIIGVTGSVGKTSTKEMLGLVLSGQGDVYSTKGNLNNHFGLPLTICQMDKNVDFGVLEMGMNHAGEISLLSKIAKPDVVIITNIEAVHLEFFESVAQIADAKSEIFDGLKDGGTAILNCDNPQFQRVKDNLAQKNAKIITFGADEAADFQLSEYIEKNGVAHIKAFYNGEEFDYELGICGKHQAINSLAVLAAVDAIGADIDKAADDLAGFSTKEGRGKRYNVACSGGSYILIDDCYNASPASVMAALDSLSGAKKDKDIRLIAVLGDMFELGNQAKALHKELVHSLLKNNVDLVFTAGDLMAILYGDLPDKIKGKHAVNSSELTVDLKGFLQDGDVVLVKGSRGMKMENVVNYLLEQEQRKNVV